MSCGWRDVVGNLAYRASMLTGALIVTMTWAGAAEPGYVDTAPAPSMGPQPNMTAKPNDPIDSNMTLAWDKWHKEVASAVYERFNSNAQANFKHSPPLSAQISYMIAKDGRIGNIRVIKPSENAIYNTMLVTVIRSMAHNPVLEYPVGSKREFVEKSGTFTWNESLGRDCPAAPLPKIGPQMVAN